MDAVIFLSLSVHSMMCFAVGLFVKNSTSRKNKIYYAGVAIMSYAIFNAVMAVVFISGG